VQKFFV